MKRKIIFFNASVILSGLNSPRGGSAKVLNWVKQSKVEGVISELVLDEVLRHSNKIGIKKNTSRSKVINIFKKNIQESPKSISKIFEKLAIDVGDSHLFESSKTSRVDYLVSLDKKHILALKNKVKDFIIVSPGELIEKLK